MIEQSMDTQEKTLTQDIWCGRTSVPFLVPTEEKTSDVSSKKPLKLPKGMPLFLNYRQKPNGLQADISWEMGGPLLGEYTMRNTGECHRDANESVYLPISVETQPHISYLILDTGEKPSTPKPSVLSQILELNPDPKYNLSAKACQGILNRAIKRGKKLPELLEMTLRKQIQDGEPVTGEVKDIDVMVCKDGVPEPLPSTKCLNPWDVQSKHIQPENGITEALYSGECRYGGGESYVMQEAQQKVYGVGAYNSKGMLSDNPNVGFYEASTTRTLDNNGGNPACNQGGMIVLEQQTKQEADVLYPNVTGPLMASGYNKLGTQEAMNGMYIVQNIEESKQNTPIVIEGNGSRESHKGDGYKESEVMYTLNTVEHHAVCTVNNEREREREVVDYSNNSTVGALCARDYKGAGNQYVDEGKLIIQRTD